MATSEEKKADDFRHVCGLCMEPYEHGKTPKLLPCFHTFCLPCLLELANKSSKLDVFTADQKLDSEKEEAENKRESGHESEPKENDGDDHQCDAFLCPTCRASVVIPDGGVYALQTNFYLDIDSADTESSESTLCQVCEEGDEKEASHYCQECEQRMCRECRRHHDRWKRSHKNYIVEFSANKSPSCSTKRSSDKRLCQYHSDQILCFHCRKCNTSICLHCKLTAHENHETEDMATAAKRANEELAGVLVKAKNQVKYLNACLNRLEMDKYDLGHQKQEHEQQINSRHEVIEIWAAQAREEFKQTLVAKAETCLVDINSETTSVSIAKERLSEAINSASAKSNYRPDIVFLKNELEDALLSEETEAHFRELASRKEQKKFFSCTSDTSVLSIELMRMYIGEMNESNSSDFIHAMKFQDIVSKVLNLEKELKNVTATTVAAKVAFRASTTLNTNYIQNQRIIYQSVTTCNPAGSYDSGTGIFTVPENGTYIFVATFSGNAFSNIALYVKGEVWDVLVSPRLNSLHATVSLNKGDQVWVAIACAGTYTIVSGASFTGEKIM